MGWQALYQVVAEMPAEHARTLPSPRPTCMVPAWALWVTYQLQAEGAGATWKAVDPKLESGYQPPKLLEAWRGPKMQRKK